MSFGFIYAFIRSGASAISRHAHCALFMAFAKTALMQAGFFNGFIGKFSIKKAKAAQFLAGEFFWGKYFSAPPSRAPEKQPTKPRAQAPRPQL